MQVLAALMRCPSATLALATQGRVVGPEVEVEGLAIDSRQVAPGQLFVPIVAERDGHDFIAAALAAGATAYLTTPDHLANRPAGGTAVVVTETAAALTRLGAWARDRLPERVVGITGSVGKTSTKDLLASVLSRRWTTTSSLRSFNNELGVPLTLFNAPGDAEAVVVEMGARGPGQVAALCAVARPNIGVVTAVGLCHAEQFGSIDAIATAKAELVASLAPAGTAVLNADDARVAAMAALTSARVLTFGTAGGSAEVRASEVRFDGQARPSFRLDTPWGNVDVALAVSGQHQVANAAAAAAAALACGVDLDDVAAGLAAASLSPWRMELARAGSGALVLNDSYNANPLSTASALRTLAAVDADRRVAVLGVMAELGELSDAEPRRIGELARSLGIRVISVGAPEYRAGEAVDSPADALGRLGPLGPGDAVLVKGSRRAGLESLAARLLS